ncbi:30S ribosomal protein S20 [Desulfatitalea alkaliphila]|uniref:Small ribosomal subunit protein bS20 n=1 Tax=Desulfatitalea alkaliphila TaxID=2929485 RepID=A0AA41R695_9BACT|nr:30S ribosomal protein S20 [Desulfatitalea alkaliphila]
MANHKSALKRAGQNQTRRLRNRAVKSRVKNVVKEVRQAVNAKAPEDAAQRLTTAQATIDKAAKKGVLHKRTAARKISRLAKLTQSMSS